MWLETQREKLGNSIISNLLDVINHGQFIMGPEVKTLEKKLAEYVGCEFAISCSSGTDALLMSLMALGIGPWTTVYTTPFSFISTVEVARLLGAEIKFVDIDPETYNINPAILEQMNPKGAGVIVPVDLFGLPCDYNSLSTIAENFEMSIICDAAQSLGGGYGGIRVGNFGDITCTSFFPSKPLGCYGDGRKCFTNGMTFKHILESIRVHGKFTNKYDNHRIGLNARLDTIQAAVLLAKLEIFGEEIEKRGVVADLYNELLKDNDLIKTPHVPSGYKSAWAQYSVLAKDEDTRSELRNKLQNEGIDAPIYYPTPLHLQPAFRDLYYLPGDFPVTEDVCKRIFSLPMHPYLTHEEQKRIVEVLK